MIVLYKLLLILVLLHAFASQIIIQLDPHLIALVKNETSQYAQTHPIIAARDVFPDAVNAIGIGSDYYVGTTCTPPATTHIFAPYHTCF